MIGISLTLASIFIPKIRSIVETSNSTSAIYAADTGVEVCLYEARHNPAAPIPRPILTNGALFTIASISKPPVDRTNDCRPLGGSTFKIRVVGSFNNVSRALEVSQ